MQKGLELLPFVFPRGASEMKVIIGLIEHFGDIVACEPVARYLREKYPQAHISWAVLRPYRELIDANPHIDEALILGCLTDWIKLCKHNNEALIVDLHVNLRVCEQCRVPLIKEHGNPLVTAYEYFDYGPILEAFCLGAGLPRLSAQPQVYIADEHRIAVENLRLPPQYCVIHRESTSRPRTGRRKNGGLSRAICSRNWQYRSWKLVRLKRSRQKTGLKKPTPARAAQR